MQKKNSVSTTIATPGITNSDTTIPVTELSRFYDKDGNLITEGIEIGFLNNDQFAPEEITITGASGTSGPGNLTGATRGVNADGSIGAAAAWDAGTEIAVMFTLGIYQRIRNAFGSWTSYSPTVTWPGGIAPTITSAVYRFVRNGDVVHVSGYLVYSNGNGAGSPTFSLPVSANQIANFKQRLASEKRFTTGGGSSQPSDPFAYVDFTQATPLINFDQFGILPVGDSGLLSFNGSYEVNT
jgi:hypothetical protein